MEENKRDLSFDLLNIEVGNHENIEPMILLKKIKEDSNGEMIV